MRKSETNLQVAENRRTKVVDMGVISERYSQSMKKKQPTLYPLRFENNTQREMIRKAARLEGRSMNNYILRVILPKAAADIQGQANAALKNLA